MNNCKFYEQNIMNKLIKNSVSLLLLGLAVVAAIAVAIELNDMLMVQEVAVQATEVQLDKAISVLP